MASDTLPGPAAAQRWPLIVGLVGVLVSAVLVGWLGVCAARDHRADVRRELFVRAARQTAVDLTTIGYQDARGDVQRVLDAATGELYQRFSERAEMLIDTVTREHSQSVGSVSEAGVETQSADAADVLVAISVASTHLGGLEQRPHELRMRITVQWVGGQAKISDVEYVR
ncbi:MAG: Mce protein [Mycobacterium sp.]